MANCRKCEAKQQEIERQRQFIDEQTRELDRAKDRIKELEQALIEACDYAEVCKHFPGAEALAERA